MIDAYITTPITPKSYISKFCMKYELGNTDTAVFCNTDGEYCTDFNKYRYRLKIPIPTQLYFSPYIAVRVVLFYFKSKEFCSKSPGLSQMDLK